MNSQSIRRNHILSLLFFLLIGISVNAQIKSKSEIVDEAKANSKHISATLLGHKVDAGKEFYLIDIRTEKEYEAGHIQGAIWIPRGKLEFSVPKLITDPAAEIVLYCRTGSRSALAAVSLGQIGYTKVVDVTGGVKAWIEANKSLYNMHGEIKVIDYLKEE